MHSVFFGADGLRAGWALALFFLVLEVARYCVFPLIATFFPTPRSHRLYQPTGVLVPEAAAFLCVLVATLVMAWIERRPASEYGARGRHRMRNFLAGLGWGFALLSLLVFGLHAAGLLAFDGWRLSGRSMLHYGTLWLAVFLAVGLYEESLSRGYLQFTLTRGFSGLYRRLGSARADATGFWTAAIITSFGFGFGHVDNTGESPIGLIAAALIGLVFCLSLWRTGSLWWAIGFHASWDWAQSFFYGVADSGTTAEGHLMATHPMGRTILSGGLTGPEGSLFVLPVIALAAAIVLVTLPRNRIQPSRERQ
jgi:uncharacterized protein